MKLIAGVDEVGRGPLAGPVVAAVAVFEEGYKNKEIKDSKKLSQKKREQLIPVIKRDAVSWAIMPLRAQVVDEINIREATKLAMSLAVSRIEADLVLVDGNMSINTDIDQLTVVKGDSKHVEIAAASILAKVYRDNYMKLLERIYPDYGFSKHAGYPTKMHREVIAEIGPSPVHRKTFKGVKEHLS